MSRPKKSANDKQAHPTNSKLFLCTVSGDEKGTDADWRINFDVLIPARDIDDVPRMLEKHLKGMHKNGTALSKDRAVTLYLDNIIEFMAPITRPLAINYRQTKLGPEQFEIGCDMPEECEGVLASYGWSADGAPPKDEEEGTMTPFLVFKGPKRKTRANT